jgi:hypothetical protein
LTSIANDTFEKQFHIPGTASRIYGIRKKTFGGVS